MTHIHEPYDHAKWVAPDTTDADVDHGVDTSAMPRVEKKQHKDAPRWRVQHRAVHSRHKAAQRGAL